MTTKEGLVLNSGKSKFNSLEPQDSTARFEKEVLYTGRFRHPSTGNIHEFSRSDLEHIARQSNTLSSNGISIPFPDGHVFDSRSNLGFWTSFEVRDSVSRPGAHGLFAIAHVPLASDIEKIGNTITEVSVMLEQEVRLTDGTDLEGPVCTHVCATNYPVIPGQGNFVATLSRDEGNINFVQLSREVMATGGDRKMDLIKVLAAALGLNPEASPESIGLAVKGVVEEREKLKTKNAELLAAVNAETSGSGEPAMTDRERELSREVARLSQEKSRTLLDAALDQAKITRAEHELLSLIIPIGKVNVVPLGKTDAQEVDCFDVVSKLLEQKVFVSSLSTGQQSTAGVTDELSKKQTSAANKASYFQRKGFGIEWLDDDKTTFNVVQK